MVARTDNEQPDEHLFAANLTPTGTRAMALLMKYGFYGKLHSSTVSNGSSLISSSISMVILLRSEGKGQHLDT